MADYVLAGDAQEVAQVDTLDITGYDAATTYRVTIGGKIVGVAGVTDAPATEAALVTAFNASPYNEFEEITASRPGSSIILTADESGIPFTAVSSVSGGTGTIGDVTASVACEGPNVLCANNCKNVSTGARGLPTGGDTLTIEHLDVDLLYLLEALSGVTLASLASEASMTGLVGLVPYNAGGNYNEYRPLYLKAPASAVTIGAGDGDGSNLLLYDASNVQTAIVVKKTGSDPEIDGLYPCILKGTHAGNTLLVEGASQVEVAPFAGETSTFAMLTASGSSTVRTNAGVTLTTVNCTGGSSIEIISAAGLADITTINIYDEGIVTIRGDNAVGTINVYGDQAVLVYLGSGTITALNLIDGATIDASDNPNPFTVTTLTGSGRPTIRDPNSRLTVTNAVSVSNSSVFSWNWEVKPGRAITLGSP